MTREAKRLVIRYVIAKNHLAEVTRALQELGYDTPAKLKALMEEYLDRKEGRFPERF